MTKTLRERYEEKQTVITEGFLDYFKSGSDNIQKFNNSLNALNQIAQKYKMTNLQTALKKASTDFQNVVMAQQSGETPDQTKSAAVSQAVTFVTTMSAFMQTIKNITTQLPSFQNALKDPDMKNQPLSQAVGEDADRFGKMIQAQMSKAGGGFLKSMARIFKGGGGQDAQAVMSKYGISGALMAEDILKMTPTELQGFSQESASTPPLQLSQPKQDPKTNGTTEPKPAAPTQPTAGAQQAASAQPADQANQTGSANQSQQPSQQNPQQGSQQQQANQGTQPHPQAFDYIKSNIARLTNAQKQEILALLGGSGVQKAAAPAAQPASQGQIQPQPIKNVG